MQSYRRKTYIKRRFLPRGGRPFTGSAALSEAKIKELKKYDPRVEFHGNGVDVDLYRVKLYGASEADDLLVFQLTLEAKDRANPVDALKRMDTWRNHSPQRAVELQLQNMAEADYIAERNLNLRISEISFHVAKEFLAKFKGFKVIDMKPKKKQPTPKWLEWNNVTSY